MSEPVRKTLKVLEYLANPEKSVFSQSEVAIACAIPPATLSRILATFEERGLIRRQDRSHFVPLFSFRQERSFSDAYLGKTRRVLETIANQTRQSAELITLRYHSLYWQDKEQHPDLTLAIRASRGFSRELYELDSLSRIALAKLGRDWLLQQMEKTQFFSTGEVKRPMTPQEVLRTIDAIDLGAVAYDIEGNSMGVRRFTTLVSVPGEPPHFLAIAEAALGKAQMAAHIARNCEILLTARKFIETDAHVQQTA
ncbi:helix-turn-helix domain-containing protein [Polycladidibacter hongkongensis]|uniref:helix-turn-helix domain-containing protein n=1 Tax=Polycladidibacter hongkongensis TaxID=1647556 RepID=UPI000835845F|nr:helix-turn-helix domain-containing protein [Pseudovibrio hongkongensis]